MAKILLITGGVLNLILMLFHVFLGYQISLIDNIAPGYKELMIMLNVGGTLFILLFTISSLFFIKDMLTTALGKLLIIFIIILYVSRALEEVFIVSQFSMSIFMACLFISLIYIVILTTHRKNSF